MLSQLHSDAVNIDVLRRAAAPAALTAVFIRAFYRQVPHARGTAFALSQQLLSSCFDICSAMVFKHLIKYICTQLQGC